MVNAIICFIYFGAGVSLLNAIDALVRRRGLEQIDQTQRAEALLYAANAVFISVCVSYASDLALREPFLVYGFFPSMLVIGPAARMHFHSLIDPAGGKCRMVWHFLPAILAFAVESVLAFGQRQWVIDLMIAHRANPLGHPLSYAVGACLVHFLSYVVLLFLRQLRELRHARLSLPGMLTIGWAMIAMAGGILMETAFVLNSKAGLLIPLTMLATLVLVMNLLRNRFPDFFFKLRIEYKKNRYENSLLEGVDLDLIKNRLEELMLDQEIYRDYELSLSSTARMLSVSRARLSQFVNQHLGVDFRNYVNGFRVEHAKRLLAEDPKASILRICYMVGFQSKSAFNTAFRRHSDMTPSEYREQIVRQANKKKRSWSSLTTAEQKLAPN